MPEKIVSIEEGTQFDKLLRKYLWSVDVVSGNDPQSPLGGDHGYIDADARKHKLTPPVVYGDRTKPKVEIYTQHGLGALPTVLNTLLNSADADPDRVEVLRREIKVASVLLRASVAGEDTGVEMPTFQERWSAVTGEEEPASLASFNPEILAIRDHMKTLLSRDGVVVTNPRTFKSNMEQWESRQPTLSLANEPQIAEHIKNEVLLFLKQFKELARSNPRLAPYLNYLNIDAYTIGMDSKMKADASSAYDGGEDATGKPLCKALFEWNSARPATAEDIRYIARHEATHWINTALMDLQRRNRELGPEAALLTMSSGRAINEEGLAQVMNEMLHGGSVQGVVDARGAIWGILTLQDQLQDIARMVASIGWEIEYASLSPAERCRAIQHVIEHKLLQTTHIAAKYAAPDRKFWREDPAGQMYGVSYHRGSRAYREAMGKYGIPKVLAVGMHTEGLVDIEAFKKKVAS